MYEDVTGMPETPPVREAEWREAAVAMVTDDGIRRADPAAMRIVGILRLLAETGARAVTMVRALPARRRASGRCGAGREPVLDAAGGARIGDGQAVERLRGTRPVIRCVLVSLMAALLLLPAAARAQEFVSVGGALHDDAFYRVVACAASPGSACRKPFLHWPEALRGDLTIALRPTARPLAAWQREIYGRALDVAVEEINAAGAGIRLRRVDGPAAISVHVVHTPPGRRMTGTGVAGLDGVVLPLARVAVRARGSEIHTAQVAISVHARHDELHSIMLEEVVQGLGLITDIRGRAYGRSIFSQDGNYATRLEGQDAMALRRHYAPTIVLAANR